MKIILRQDHATLGKIGEVVEVKDGYARNFLIPKRIGFVATAGNLRALEEEKKQAAVQAERIAVKSRGIASELEKISVTIPMKAGEDDKLFGSVTSQMVADALKEKSFTVDKRDIELEDGIKALGIYTVDVKLQAGVVGKLKIWVVRE
jgi:large subunit ribosomal protein L9